MALRLRLPSDDDNLEVKRSDVEMGRGGMRMVGFLDEELADDDAMGNEFDRFITSGSGGGWRVVSVGDAGRDLTVGVLCGLVDLPLVDLPLVNLRVVDLPLGCFWAVFGSAGRYLRLSPGDKG